MNNVIIALEMMSMFVLGIILFGMIFETKEQMLYSKAFILCLVTSILSNLFDMFSWIHTSTGIFSTNLVNIFDICGFISTVLTIIAYGYYLLFYIGERKKVSIWIARVINIIGSVMILVLSILLRLSYHRLGENYDFTSSGVMELSLVLIALMILYTQIVAIVNIKTLGKHDFCAMIAYSLLPLIAVIITLHYGELSLGYVALAIALLILYVMLQGKKERVLLDRETLLKAIATTDQLTNLQNRRAADMTCEQLGNSDAIVGVIFCDLNALKYTNDLYGHQAGDNLIKVFCGLLNEQFIPTETYRISGDEFLIIIQNSSAKSILSRYEKLFISLQTTPWPISASGYAIGNAKDIYKIIKEAEEKMYLDKKRIYQEYPEISRS